MLPQHPVMLMVHGDDMCCMQAISCVGDACGQSVIADNQLSYDDKHSILSCVLCDACLDLCCMRAI